MRTVVALLLALSSTQVWKSVGQCREGREVKGSVEKCGAVQGGAGVGRGRAVQGGVGVGRVGEC